MNHNKRDAGLDDAAARRRAIDAPGSMLVQAPAGSGKTTLLAQRYLRLLGTVEAPERILALTFTRRAAQEMRARVMAALHAAAGDCPAEMNELTWSLGRAALRNMQTHGLEVARYPARLRIETIDSFNAWLAGQLPITAGAGASLSLVEKAQRLYTEAARRALAHEDADAYGVAVDHVLALDDQRWHTLVKLIGEMLPNRDRWLPLLAENLSVTRSLDEQQLRQVRRQLDEDLKLLVSRTLRVATDALGPERVATLSSLVHGAANRCAGLRPDMRVWEEDGSLLRACADDIARWRGAAALLLNSRSAYRERLTKREGFPPACLDRQPMLDLMAELAREPRVLRALVEIRVLPDPAYDDAQWARVRDVAQVLVLAAAELVQVFREEGAADFPALSMAALRALGTPLEPSDLSLRLDYRLQHILVDEFQDTSSAQLALIKLLTAGWQRGDGRSIFCVGDPMQSIYGFRQAEVRAFLELAEDGIGDVQLDVERLTSNFRSCSSLVEWINDNFARILPALDDRERGAIAFRPSRSAWTGVGAGDNGVILRGFENPRDEARAIADAVAHHTQRHPTWRVAILVRARNHAREIAGCLHARGIAFNAVEIEPLRDRAVVRDLVQLVCALQHLGDRTAWLTLLRAPWCGMTLADLLIIARGAPLIWEAMHDEAVLSRLSDDGQARCVRVRGVLDSAFRARTTSTVKRWVERTWLALGGPSCCPSTQEIEQARRVFARLGELEEQGLPDAGDMAQSFDDLYAVHDGPAAVEIMTIHKAKGLEFDMVVVPALNRFIQRNRNPLLILHQFARAGRDGLAMAARPGVGQNSDALFEFLRYQTRDASALEAERLLYVACTRARSQLFLTAAVGRRDETDFDDDLAPRQRARPTEWRPPVGSLLAVLWPVAADKFEIADFGRGVAWEPHREAIPSPQPPLYPTLRVPTSWSPNIDSVLRAVEDLAAPLESREETPVFDWAGETARRVGSLVHAELQAMDIDSGGETAIRARASHFRQWLALHGVPNARLPDASGRVVDALIAVHRDPRARWILKQGYLEEYREHALSGRVRGVVVRVVFDRSFVDDAGVRWVIDYKTSSHAGGAREEFLDREVERYRAQMQRYAVFARLLGPQPVRVGLYFPLMRAWREWAPA